jgi:hypothetical protein
MEKQIAFLFDHEKETLLAALRRDMRSELGKAVTDPEWTPYHLANVRAVNRLLEALDPIFSARGH